MLNTKVFHFNLFNVNTYLVWNEASEAFIVDPGQQTPEEAEAFDAFIAAQGLKVQAILLTHAHPDHIMGLWHCIDRYGAPVYLNDADKQVLPDLCRFAARIGMPCSNEDFSSIGIEDGQVLGLAGCRWTVITTPGHTPGGVCYYCEEEGMMFTGDTLFAGTIGRTDLEHGEYDHLIVSVMEKLMGLPAATVILPGHGPSSTISDERTHNPFLEPFNEPEEMEMPQ